MCNLLFLHYSEEEMENHYNMIEQIREDVRVGEYV